MGAENNIPATGNVSNDTPLQAVADELAVFAAD